MLRLAKVIRNNIFLGLVMGSYSTEAQVIRQLISKSGDFCGKDIPISVGESCELSFEAAETLKIEIMDITRYEVGQISARFKVIG